MLDLEPIKNRLKGAPSLYIDDTNVFPKPEIVFITEARHDISALIKEVEELREKVKDIEELASDWAQKHFDLKQRAIDCVEVKLGSGKIVTVRGD